MSAIFIHDEADGTDNHGPYVDVFADAAERLADATTYRPHQSLAGGINPVRALQIDTAAEYYLSDHDGPGPVWTAVGAGGVPAHAPTHEDGGSDELDLTDLAGFPGGTTDFLRADGVFAAPAGGGGSFDIRDVVIYDHFFSSNNDTDEEGIMGWREFKSGTGNNILFAGSAGHPGIAQVIGGTGAGARASIALGDSSGAGSRYVVGSALAGAITVEFLHRWADAGSILAANLEGFYAGFGLNWQDDAEILSGLYLRFAPGTSPNWFLVSATSGTRTAVDTGIVATATTWKRLGIVVTPGSPASAQARHNGSNVGTPITTNIPTTGVGFGFKVRSGGGAAATAEIDYVSVTQVTAKED